MKFIFVCFLFFFSFTVSAATPLLPAQNLQADGQLAQAQKIPIAIFLVYQGLKSGQILKEEVLEPALLSGDYDGKVLFREIAVNLEGRIIDFYGEPLANKEFQSLLNITSLPAVVFVDSEGDPLVSPLFAGSYDYYEYYLKQKINSALRALGSSKRIENE